MGELKEQGGIVFQDEVIFSRQCVPVAVKHHGKQLKE